MTPSQTIVRTASRTFSTEDRNGRRLVLRRPTALDTLRLFKAAGPILAQNEPWLSMASLAFSVMELDGVPVPAPANETQIEGLVERLGDMGLEAIAAALGEETDVFDTKQMVGNLLGTPS